MKITKNYKEKEQNKKKQKKQKNRELPENEKDVKRLYQRNRYHNMTAEKKQRLKEHQKNYCETKKATT